MSEYNSVWAFFAGLFPLAELPIGVSITCFMVGFIVSLSYVTNLLSKDYYYFFSDYAKTAGFCVLFFILFSFLNVSIASLFMENYAYFFIAVIAELVLLLAIYFGLMYMLYFKPKKDGKPVHAYKLSTFIRIDLFVTFTIFGILVALFKLLM